MTRRLPLLLTSLMLLPSLAQAQGVGPQACGQDTASADYGGVGVGTVVVAQRHRYVNEDPNWRPAMGRYLGRAAQVTRLSGVDDQGCPGLRLDVDGGEHFWRLRDVTIGAERPAPRPPSRAEEERAPTACGMTDETVDYGPIVVGATVTLGRHEAVGGDENWTAPMSLYVGQTARVTELAGVDDVGCPGVLVDADGSQWFWRIRALTLMSDPGPADSPPGVSSDHGRDLSRRRSNPGRVDGTGGDFVQACGFRDETVRYGAVQVGTRVVLGRHREVEGADNWVAAMDSYVGREAEVVELIGVDSQGCPLIRVNVDNGDWLWRLRDARRPSPDIM